jgi:hypothetical protein
VLVVSALTAVADIGTVIYEVHLQRLTLAAILVIGAIGAMVILSFVGGYLLSSKCERFKVAHYPIFG